MAATCDSPSFTIRSRAGPTRVVMNVLQGLAAGVTLDEMSNASPTRPLAEVFRAIAPRERRHTELGHHRASPTIADHQRKAAPPPGKRSPTGNPRSPTASAPRTPLGSRR